jgi:hypothetical protein
MSIAAKDASKAIRARLSTVAHSAPAAFSTKNGQGQNTQSGHEAFDDTNLTVGYVQTWLQHLAQEALKMGDRDRANAFMVMASQVV